MADLVTDQRMANFSKRIGRDIKDDRVRITGNEIDIRKLNETVGIHSKQLDNLTAAAQGKNFTFQTDADAAYSKLVPAGAMPYAGVKSIGGKTLVWNQLVKNLGYPISEGTGGSIVNATTNENKCSATVLLGSYYRWYIGFNISNSLKILNHKYYISSFIKSTGDINPTKIRLAINHTNGLKDISFTKDGKYSSIVTCNGSGVSLVCGWYDTTHIGNEVSFEVSNVIIIDLTLMFGTGNEPATVEEFEAMFPADYYEYNAGEILSAGVSEVQSAGKNLFPPIEIGYNIRFDNIDNFTLNDGILTVKGASSVSQSAWSAGWIYFLYKQSKKGGNLFLESGDIITIICKINVIVDGFPDTTSTKYQFFLSSGDAYTNGYTSLQDGFVSTTITVKHTGFYYIIFTCSSSELELSEFMITKTDSRIPYTPYKETTATIPPAVQNLPGYGWSAGTAKNWVDWEKKIYHREVQKYEFTGDENPDYYNLSKTDYVTLRYGVLPEKSAGYNKKTVCSHFVHADNTWNQNSSESVCTEGGNKRSVLINVARTRFSDSTDSSVIASEFGTWLKAQATADYPLTIYYELATPELIDISDLLPADNLIEVEAGGTLTFKNQHGDDYRIPVPSEVEYMINVEEAL